MKNVNATVIEVDSDLSKINISPSVKVWGDTSFNVLVEEVLALEEEEFIAHQNDFFSFHRLDACPWVKFQLVNTDTQSVQFFLNIDNHRLSKVNWYVYRKGERINEVQTGDNLKFSQRPVKHLNYLLPIEMLPNDTLDCFLYLYRGTNIIYTNLFLQSNEDFIAESTIEKYKMGILIGVSLFFVIIAFVGLLLYRTKLMLYYFLMVITMFVFCLIAEGIGYQYFWAEGSKLLKRFMVIGTPIIQLFAFQLFGMTYFKTKKLHPKIHRWMIRVFVFIILLTLIGVPLVVMVKDNYEWYRFSTLILIFMLEGAIIFAFTLTLVIGIKELIKHRQLEYLAFVAVMLVYLVFVISRFLQSVGVVLFFTILKYSLFPGFIFEMVALTFIIVSKYKKDIKEKESLERIYNENQLLIANRLLEGEGIERQRIASDLHDSLGSLLSISKLYLSQVEIPNKKIIEQSIEKAQTATRRISNALMPKALSSMGVIAAVEDLFELTQKNNDVNIDLVNNELKFSYSDFQKINIYRLVEELLNVAITESQAKNINFQLTEFDDELNLIVEDDGTQQTFIKESTLTRIKALKGKHHLDENPLHKNNVVIDLQLST